MLASLNCLLLGKTSFDFTPHSYTLGINDLDIMKLWKLRNFFSDQPLVVVDENIYVIVQVPAAAAGPPQQGVPQDSIYKWIQQFTLRRDRNRLVTYFVKWPSSTPPMEMVPLLIKLINILMQRIKK
ncbi:unnamed protein product [Rhizophagus irregularis]|nr:unnamed protein product [Rhizophagus irregularis]